MRRTIVSALLWEGRGGEGKGEKGALMPCYGYSTRARNCVKRRLVTVESPSRSPLEGRRRRQPCEKPAGALCKSTEVNSNIIPLDFSIFLLHGLARRGLNHRHRVCNARAATRSRFSLPLRAERVMSAGRRFGKIVGIDRLFPMSREKD